MDKLNQNRVGMKTQTYRDPVEQARKRLRWIKLTDCERELTAVRFLSAATAYSQEEPYVRGASAEPYVRGASEEPYVRGASEEPYVRGASNVPYVHGASKEPYAHGASEEPQC